MGRVRFQISRHAKTEMVRRAISPDLLDGVLACPQQVVSGQGGKKVYQSKVDFETGKTYLVRAVVADDRAPATVVTVYRTSKIDKYWRQP